jgi:hypothetical protein
MIGPNDTSRPVSLGLTTDELLILNNALNEVCNGIDIDDFEFSARIGVDREEARGLLHRITALYDEVSRRRT